MLLANSSYLFFHQKLTLKNANCGNFFTFFTGKVQEIDAVVYLILLIKIEHSSHFQHFFTFITWLGCPHIAVNTDQNVIGKINLCTEENSNKKLES